MKIETAKLKGKALDWVVGTLLGWDKLSNNPLDRPESYTLRPSSDWGVGGRLLYEYDISVWLTYGSLAEKGKWSACMPDWFDLLDPTAPLQPEAAYGDTQLEAAMRALVRHELGDEVDIPEELACR